MKTRRPALLLTVVPLLLVFGLGALALLATRAPALAAAAAAPVAPPADLAQPPAGAPRDALQAGPQARAHVERVVAERNAAARAESEGFQREGWTLVDVPAPDADLLALSPALLHTREPELRLQIASNTAAPAQLDNLAVIAAEGAPETQAAAIEALGRVQGPGNEKAQAALTRLLLDLPADSAARREIAPLLRPASLSSAQAVRLAQLLDDPALLPAEREQIAFTLALVSLRDSSSLPAATLDALSPRARALLARMTALARLDPIPTHDGDAP